MPCFSSARRVRIESTTGEPIQFFEFQVHSSGTNIALHGTAIQSSNFAVRTDASKAIDGSNSTFSHTKDPNAYWEVDLGDMFDIDSIVIVNRYCGSDPADRNECLCRLSSANLMFLGQSNTVLASKIIGNSCGQLVLEVLGC
jgi:hypothetical protein